MKNSIVLTLLSESDLDKLKIFELYGKKACYSDMYLVTGGDECSSDMDRIPDGLGLKSRVAPYSLKEKNIGSLRVVIDTYSDVFSKIIKNKYFGYNGVCEVEFGEYPQYAAAYSVNEALEYHYQRMLFDESCGVLIPTGKTYSIIEDGNIVKYNEFYHDGKKYIRANVSNKTILSSADTFYKGDSVWVEVSPIKWLVDEKEEKLVSKSILLNGIDNKVVNFFCNEYMIDDMINSSLNKSDIIEMINYVLDNVNDDVKSLYLELVSKYDDLYSLTLIELENLLLKISKLNDKISNFDYELTWKMR